MHDICIVRKKLEKKLKNQTKIDSFRQCLRIEIHF